MERWNARERARQHSLGDTHLDFLQDVTDASIKDADQSLPGTTVALHRTSNDNNVVVARAEPPGYERLSAEYCTRYKP